MATDFIVKSISFDPQVFEGMETRRDAFRMGRSEYVNRLIMNDLAKKNEALEVRDPGLVHQDSTDTSNTNEWVGGVNKLLTARGRKHGKAANARVA